jgi:hypothetical protein
MEKDSTSPRATEQGQSSKPSEQHRARKNLRRHARKCNVCRHPDRGAIDQDFLRWRSPDAIAKDYGVADHSSVYRHAHAVGLFDRRAQTVRLALHPIIEQAMTVRVNADSVIRAVIAYTHINPAGQWIETRERKQRDPNRQTRRVENDPSHSK